MIEPQSEFSISQRNDICVISVHDSRLDSTKAPGFKTELLRIIGTGVKKVLVDMESVQSIDSSGLGILTFGRRQMDETGGKIALCCLQEKVLTLFKIAKLDRVFAIFDTQKEGLKKM